MKLKPIVNQLATFLPFNTNFFTTNIDIISLSRVATVATATTATNHNLSIGQTVLITEAVELVPISTLSLNIDNDQVTARTTLDHGLSLGMNFENRSPTNLTVTLQDISEPEYNGTFKLLEVPNRNSFIFQLLTTPINPPTNDGNVLNFSSNFFTGVKTVLLVPNTTTFTYAISNNASLTTTDNASVRSNWRISAAIDLQRAIDSYTKQDTNNYWLFVAPESSVASKNRHILNDSVTTLVQNQQQYRQRLIESFSAYVFAPTSDELNVRQVIDNLEDVKVALFKSILRFPTSAQYDADSNSTTQFVFTYNSSQVVSYNTSFVVMQYIFDTNYDITYNDTFNANEYSPFRNINALSVIKTQDFIWNIDLDVDPDF